MPRRVLVIEDNPANLELMTYLLQAFGFGVVAAVDGEAGLEAARVAQPDLILCDVQLPGIDGYAVARELKGDAALRSVPLIAITALAMMGDREKVLIGGFDGYIAKPIDPETFVSDVEAYLINKPPSSAGPVVHARTESTPDEPLSSPRNATILVVDNSQVNIELGRSTFEPFGYTVYTATGVTQTLELARRISPDLILSDVNMDGENGYDLIRAVKADPALRATPFVFLSATARSVSDRATGLALGAADYITRPIDPEALLARVAACLPKQRDGD